MGADLFTLFIDDYTWLSGGEVLQPVSGVTLWNEADVIGVRLIRNTKTALLGLFTDQVLGGGSTEWEKRVLELLGSQNSQNIGLVFCHFQRAVQF